MIFFVTSIHQGQREYCLVSRFSTDKIQENSEFPVKAKLLSEAEIVCILANSYFCDNDDPVYPSDDQILEILSACKIDVSTAHYHHEDALLIEHYLEKKDTATKFKRTIFKSLGSHCKLLRKFIVRYSRSYLFHIMEFG